MPTGLWACLGEPISGFAITALPDQHAAAHAACLARAQADLTAATPDEIDQAIIAVSGLQLSVKQGVSAQALGMAYQIGLDDVPPDLLAKAVRLALKHKVFRPMPAELREFIADELDARQRRLARLRT